MYVFKLCFDSDIRRITFAEQPAYKQLVKLTTKLFASTGLPEIWTLKYEDDEKDLISINSQAELAEAYKFIYGAKPASNATKPVARLTIVALRSYAASTSASTSTPTPTVAPAAVTPSQQQAVAVPSEVLQNPDWASAINQVLEQRGRLFERRRWEAQGRGGGGSGGWKRESRGRSARQGGNGSENTLDEILWKHGNKIYLRSLASGKLLRINDEGSVDGNGSGEDKGTEFLVFRRGDMPNEVRLRSSGNPQYFLEINVDDSLRGNSFGGAWASFSVDEFPGERSVCSFRLACNQFRSRRVGILPNGDAKQPSKTGRGLHGLFFVSLAPTTQLPEDRLTFVKEQVRNSATDKKDQAAPEATSAGTSEQRIASQVTARTHSGPGFFDRGACERGMRHGLHRHPPRSAESQKFQSRFVSHGNVQDGAHIKAGTSFLKTWKIKNCGTVAWPEGTELIFVAGDRLSDVTSVPVPYSVEPEQEIELLVEMTAPKEMGRFVSNWRLCAPGGIRFGQRVWADITVMTIYDESEGESKPVRASASGRTPTPSAMAFKAAQPAITTLVPLVPVIGKEASAEDKKENVDQTEKEEKVVEEKEEPFKRELEQLQLMGFTDKEANLRALNANGGDIVRTVNQLTQAT